MTIKKRFYWNKYSVREFYEICKANEMGGGSVRASDDYNLNGVWHIEMSACIWKLFCTDGMYICFIRSLIILKSFEQSQSVLHAWMWLHFSLPCTVDISCLIYNIACISASLCTGNRWINSPKAFSSSKRFLEYIHLCTPYPLPEHTYTHPQILHPNRKTSHETQTQNICLYFFLSNVFILDTKNRRRYVESIWVAFTLAQ